MKTILPVSITFILLLGCGGSDSPGPRTSTGPGGSGGGQGGGGPGPNFMPGCGYVVKENRCLDTGWCWEDPRPQGGDLFSISGTAGAKSAWAVGRTGSAWHLCGDSWYPIETGTSVDLFHVWQSAPDHAIAVGREGTVLRWDGAVWTALDFPVKVSLFSVWGTGPGDFWIGGSPQGKATTLVHYDGQKFEPAKDLVAGQWTLMSIHGRGPNDIYAVGGNSDVDITLHFDGTAWQHFPYGSFTYDFGPLTDVLALKGGGAVALFAGFNSSQVWISGGSTWDNSYEAPVQSMFGLFEDQAGEARLWRRWDVTEVDFDLQTLHDGILQSTGETTGEDPWATWMDSITGDAFVVGRAAAVRRRVVGGAWTQVDEVKHSQGFPILLGAASTGTWLATTTALLRRDTSQGWVVEELFSDTVGSQLDAASMDQAGRLYAAFTDGKVRVRDSGSWTTLPPLPAYATPVHWILGRAPDDVWVSEGSYPKHWDGSKWDDPAWCNFGAYTFREAPDGKIGAVGPTAVTLLDMVAESCQKLAADPSEPTVDVFWPSVNDTWAISRSGALYQRVGSALVKRGNVPGFGDAKVDSAAAVGAGKVRVVGDRSVPGTTEHERFVVVFDPANLSVAEMTLTMPKIGEVWMPDAQHAFVAFTGGVMRYGE